MNPHYESHYRIAIPASGSYTFALRHPKPTDKVSPQSPLPLHRFSVLADLLEQESLPLEERVAEETN